ncbi:hypothetical protein [Stutzerimonas tarimensis]|uniref:DUF2892 domain-containing protein n=1 Tax=Stutzerimonas tarimensis TaxID=1507735 RepID=A0ABV7T6T6_9GAMM
MKLIPDKNEPQNLHGWERAASVGGGLILLGKGMRRGGLIGLAQMAVGGLALVRGMSGRCEAKRLLDEPKHTQPDPSIERYSHMPLDSEVHSPDFEAPGVALPDTTPMGHETHPDEKRP